MYDKCQKHNNKLNSISSTNCNVKILYYYIASQYVLKSTLGLIFELSLELLTKKRLSPMACTMTPSMRMGKLDWCMHSHNIEVFMQSMILFITKSQSDHAKE